MTKDDKQIDVELVDCEVCLKEVPKSEATVPEAMDYVAHFCGLNCYEKWKSKLVKSDNQAKKSSS